MGVRHADSPLSAQATSRPSFALWQACDLVRLWNAPHRDIARKLRVRPDLFLVGEIAGQIVASVMAGYDGHRGWINYLAVDPQQRRRGLARAILAEVERLLHAAGCPKINLQVRSSNAGVIEFYRRVGYTVDEVVSLGKRLVPDAPAESPRDDRRWHDRAGPPAESAGQDTPGEAKMEKGDIE